VGVDGPGGGGGEADYADADGGHGWGFDVGFGSWCCVKFPEWEMWIAFSRGGGLSRMTTRVSLRTVWITNEIFEFLNREVA
jgi:hypothetical protein